jgi:hypothetical protein
VEILSNPRYAEVTNRTRAVVSFAGALRGSPLASSPVSRVVLKLLRAYCRFSQRVDFRAKLLKWIVDAVVRFRINDFREWRELLDKAEEFADDLSDLPDGITDLTTVITRKEYAHVQIPQSVKLFSISAVYPESEFKGGFQFITNPDDLFLYVFGRELYQHHVFNDTQVLFPDSQFFEGTGGDIVDLGIVKADHWGVCMPHVLSRRYEDPFPRTEMVKAVLLTLDEYFNQPHASSS